MKLLAVFFLFAVPLCVSAQSNYHKGTITDNNGQTQAGYINYREWDNSPKYIEFKTSLADKKPRAIFPATIKSFNIDDFEEYYTYQGKITLNKATFPDLDHERDTTTQQAIIFMKVIALGSKLSLFSYTDSIKTRFFVQEKEQQPLELLYQQYYTEGNSVQSIPTYIGQFNYLATKYLQINTATLNKIERAKYNTDDIEQIVNEINGVAVKKNRKKGEPYIRYYAGAALNMSTTAIDGYYAEKKSVTYSPKLSVGIDIFNNPSVQQLIFRTEVALTYINPQILGYYDYASYLAKNNSETISFDQYNASVTPQLIVNIYNTDSFKFYIDAGVCFNFSVYKNSKRRFDSTSFSGTTSSQYIQPYDMELSWANFPLQAGIVLNKRIEIFVSRSAPTAYTKYSNIALSSDIYNVGVHLLLKKASNNALQ